MPGLLKNMSPGQKKMLEIGAPIVAVVALYMIVKGKKTSTGGAPTAGNIAIDPATGQPYQAELAAYQANTNALGTGQLSSFEDTVTGALNGLQQQLAATPAPTSTPPAATPTTPTPLTADQQKQAAFVTAANGGLGPQAQQDAQNLIAYINAGHPQGLPAGFGG